MLQEADFDRIKVKGYAGPDHQMTLSLGRAENDTNSQNAMCGNCVVPAGSDASAADYCRGPRTNFTVPADGSETTVTLYWTDFHDGSPHDSIDPHQVTGILWLFHRPVVLVVLAGMWIFELFRFSIL